MADLVFNIAKGTVNQTAIDGGDVRVLLMKTIGADATVEDLDNVAAVLATGSEADFTNYSREAVTGLTSPAPNDTNDTRQSQFDDVGWPNAGGTTDNNILAVLVYLQVTNDADSIPLTKHDVNFNTNGSTVTIQNPAAGFFIAN